MDGDGDVFVHVVTQLWPGTCMWGRRNVGGMYECIAPMD